MMYCFDMGALYHHVCVVTTQKDILSLNETFGIDLPHINDTAGYMAYAGEANLCIIAIKKKRPSVLAHEAVHAVNAMFNKLGHHYSYDNDELMAYGVGFIIKNAYLPKHKCDDLLEYMANELSGE